MDLSRMDLVETAVAGSLALTAGGLLSACCTSAARTTSSPLQLLADVPKLTEPVGEGR
jgi:hypothetical protein